MSQEIIVDCRDFESGIKTLSCIFNKSEQFLLYILKKINIESIYEESKSEYEFHYYICKKYNLIPRDIEKIVWFHFSKTLNPYSYYKNGLLPTDECLELIKEDCYKLIKDDFSADEWNMIWYKSIVELPENDSCKFRTDPPDFGPNGMMIKDAGLYPGGCTRCFFERPEIVEGILSTIDKNNATNIMDIFSRKAQSCVVTFIADSDKKIHEVTTAILFYIYNVINGRPFANMDSCTNYDGKNKAIIPENILEVQIITFDNANASLQTVDR
ncbi:hypothetical protein [Bilophila wadsworthia]|uniref:hypothetical protein n=1 Tax=Bilophila wadsworthia TaxID=35833 RepID=UPI00242AE7C1|nr:hypothetical protein [Bilophila wadsworthia]